MIPKTSVSFDDDGNVDRLMDWCMWGPFELAQKKSKAVRLLAMFCWPFWFAASFPILFVCGAIVVWREI